ncbi:MAG: protein kinase [Gemmatimonas sp.]
MKSETILGHYRLDAELGRGGMGIVFRATDLRLNRPVALKVVHRAVAEMAGLSTADLRARLKHEAQLAGRIIHPNVVTVFAYDDVGDDALIAMELVEGQTLADVLALGHRWAPRDAAFLLAQIADGVAAAHSLGIVHRDLKPGNVMITTDGRCKVLDFGIAKATSADIAAAVSRTTFGTVQYMAPEQVLGKVVTTATDVWALAVIGYEMVTGAPAFGDGAAITIGMRVAGESPPYMSDLKVARQIFGPLAPVLQQALQKSAAMRYEDARGLRAALLESAGVKPEPEPVFIPGPAITTDAIRMTGPRTGGALRTPSVESATPIVVASPQARYLTVALAFAIVGVTAASVQLVRPAVETVSPAGPGDAAASIAADTTSSVVARVDSSDSQPKISQIKPPSPRAGSVTPATRFNSVAADRGRASDSVRRPEFERSLASDSLQRLAADNERVAAERRRAADSTQRDSEAQALAAQAEAAKAEALRVGEDTRVQSDRAAAATPVATLPSAETIEMPTEAAIREAAKGIVASIARGMFSNPELKRFFADASDPRVELSDGSLQRRAIGPGREEVTCSIRMEKFTTVGKRSARALVTFEMRNGVVVSQSVSVGALRRS